MIKLVHQTNAQLFSYRNESNATPLQCASVAGNECTIKYLFKFDNLQINNQDVEGDTALHTCPIESIPLLLNCDGIKVNIVNQKGYSPFMSFLVDFESSKMSKIKNSKGYRAMNLYIEKFPEVLSFTDNKG